MTTFEIIISFLASSVFLSLLGMFYRMGAFHKELDLRFQAIEDKFTGVEQDLKEIRRDLARMDKDIAVITATMRFNGFDLDRHKAEGEI